MLFLEDCVNLEVLEVLHVVRNQEDLIFETNEDEQIDRTINFWHSFPVLQEVILGTFATDNYVVCLVKVLKSLRKLKIASKNITDVGAEAIFKCSVVEADLRGCLGVTGDDLIKITQVGQLQKIKLSLNNFNYAKVIQHIVSFDIVVEHYLYENK